VFLEGMRAALTADAAYAEGGRDANNLLSMITTSQRADVSANERYGGDFEAAMAAIRAEVLVMPGQTDLSFPPEDSGIEVALLRHGELRVIPSVWGHYAGGGRGGRRGVHRRRAARAARARAGPERSRRADRGGARGQMT